MAIFKINIHFKIIQKIFLNIKIYKVLNYLLIENQNMLSATLNPIFLVSSCAFF